MPQNNLTPRLKQMGQRIQQAERQSLRQGQRMAVQASSGPFSLAQLRGMGHPYRNPANPGPAPAVLLDPSVINKQGGGFAGDWKSRGPDRSSDGRSLKSAIVNNNPVGVFLKGTKRMVARPVEERVARQLEPERNRRLRNAIRTDL